MYNSTKTIELTKKGFVLFIKQNLDNERLSISGALRKATQFY